MAGTVGFDNVTTMENRLWGDKRRYFAQNNRTPSHLKRSSPLESQKKAPEQDALFSLTLWDKNP
jgi:hypothetical protein